MKTLWLRAHDAGWTVYVFGRFYDDGDGAHDVHMNQGSTGETITTTAAIPVRIGTATTSGRTAH